jgi:hypothetical protein
MQSTEPIGVRTISQLAIQVENLGVSRRGDAALQIVDLAKQAH